MSGTQILLQYFSQILRTCNSGNLHLHLSLGIDHDTERVARFRELVVEFSVSCIGCGVSIPGGAMAPFPFSSELGSDAS